MNVLKLYQTLSRYPFGRRAFSMLFCLKAPYFGTIRPYFAELSSGRCVVTMSNRRSVHNHIGTVHAIAMCNLAEATAGTCVEASLDRSLRWIPAKMQVEYLKKATTDLKAVCETVPAELVAGENRVTVNVFDTNNERVFVAQITMFISPRK
jgi:uncharacterized protein (TIGR00369 family)